jgi:hypothetical protein
MRLIGAPCNYGFGEPRRRHPLTSRVFIWLFFLLFAYQDLHPILCEYLRGSSMFLIFLFRISFPR